MEKPWKVVFAFVGVFVAGAVFGGFFTLRTNRGMDTSPAVVEKNEGPRRRPLQQIGAAMIRQYVQRLKLTDEQRENIQPIVARAEEDLQRLRRENFQTTTRVMEQLHADVAAWLTPEQHKELETMKRNMRERLRRAQENKAQRSELWRGGTRATGAPDSVPGEQTAADDRKGN